MGRLLHSGLDTFLPRGRRIWTRTSSGLGKGLWFCLDPRFDAGGDYEPWLQSMLEQQLKPGECFYDVGAHIGFFSLIAARLVGHEGLVVALEADPENAALLRAHVAQNHAPHVTVVEAAAWSSSGQLRFERAPEASNRSQGHVSEAASGNTTEIVVPAVSLDDLVFRDSHRAPQLVKIDVEGAEWEVLQGARRLLSERKPRLLCEVHNAEIAETIQGFLNSLGYATDHRVPEHPWYAKCEQSYIRAAHRA